MRRLHRFLADRRGATAIEYGLIAALIAVAAISSISIVGNRVGKTFVKVSNQLPSS